MSLLAEVNFRYIYCSLSFLGYTSRQYGLGERRWNSSASIVTVYWLVRPGIEFR